MIMRCATKKIGPPGLGTGLMKAMGWEDNTDRQISPPGRVRSKRREVEGQRKKYMMVAPRLTRAVAVDRIRGERK